ncbi:ABC transporter ATP-binding protein [Lentilactobacillus sp. SPB1-3]|uniref:ATP-binding cassette domain-containing protein n=1 Tax=Lentilactobacillus terminaliae TaxID=3003483 RepID=A0ACD5DEL6_9LACO|nr:ABC transporter ATP-binding protein [Lentilactobacillus sp. SPB1-3]MCZ0977488.1 ABC transporter ATP-binding protein [Lentilactobacillus sp. SPB1-3]
MSLLSIDHVSKAFGSHNVLSDISLTFEEGKIYGLLGRNGAGKSTLLNIITDRIFANSGEVHMDSENVADNDSKLGMMYLMSEVDLYNDGDKLTKIMKDTELLYGGFDHELAESLATKFGLDLNQKFGKLSTGYNSIFKLIVALSVPAKFILLDEPVLGLDANHRELFYSELIQTFSDRPRTFIISTHLIEEVANIVSDVVMIDMGHVLLDQSVESILTKNHSVVGPSEEVDQYTNGLNVIGSEQMSNLKTNYVFGNLNDDRPIPDTVQVGSFDLQKLFIFLTNIQGNGGSY